MANRENRPFVTNRIAAGHIPDDICDARVICRLMYNHPQSLPPTTAPAPPSRPQHPPRQQPPADVSPPDGSQIGWDRSEPERERSAVVRGPIAAPRLAVACREAVATNRGSPGARPTGGHQDAFVVGDSPHLIPDRQAVADSDHIHEPSLLQRQASTQLRLLNRGVDGDRSISVTTYRDTAIYGGGLIDGAMWDLHFSCPAVEGVLDRYRSSHRLPAGGTHKENHVNFRKTIEMLDRCHRGVRYWSHVDRRRPTGRGRRQGDAGAGERGLGDV